MASRPPNRCPECGRTRFAPGVLIVISLAAAAVLTSGCRPAAGPPDQARGADAGKGDSPKTTERQPPVAGTGGPVAPARPDPPPPEVAPPPRVALPFPPAPGYASNWARVGAVEARVAGVAVTRPPITTADRRPGVAPVPVLVVWVEVRTEARRVELKRWQDALAQYCSLSGRNGIISRGSLGPGASLRTGMPYTQPVSADGIPALEVVAFSVPAEEDGDLTLSLDAGRVGLDGTFNLPIPASAWKK
jgi:hypothetical protein